MGWVWFFAGWFGLCGLVILLLWWSNARPFYEPDPQGSEVPHKGADIIFGNFTQPRK